MEWIDYKKSLAAGQSDGIENKKVFGIAINSKNELRCIGIYRVVIDKTRFIETVADRGYRLIYTRM